jgi:hypothetical protein
MVDFRKAILLLAVLVFATGIASAQQALNCTLNGGAPPLLRAEGVAEEVGQAFITCQGGTRTAVGQPVPRINVRVFTPGYNITSKLLSGGASEATLLIDDPAPSAQVWANWPTPPVCNGPYSSSCGNMFFAHQVTGNAQAIEWRDIPFDPPGTPGFTRTLRFVNIRVNAALATGGNVTSLVPPSVSIFVSITGTFTLPITSPFLTVGYIQNGLQFTLRNSANDATITAVNISQCVTPSVPAFHARFSELFPNSFRIRGGSGANIPYGPPYQNDLTQIYNTESMFWGGVPGDATYLNSGAGQASQATRLRLAFSGIPSGVLLYVPNLLTSGGITASLVGVGVDGNTTQALSSNPSWYTGPNTASQISLTGGAGAAIFEVSVANPGATQNWDLPVYIRYSGLPALGSGNVLGSYAPLSTTDTASSTAPVPRFVQNPAATYPINLAACETRLLFPFVTSIPGWDTGIAISNTTADPFGTAAQSGVCTLHFYGTPSNSTQTSASIASGAQLLFAMSQGNAAQNVTPLTGFTGYLIARCNFQYAHGYAFISDLGVNRFAQGYIALVIGSGLTSRYSINPAEALAQ